MSAGGSAAAGRLLEIIATYKNVSASVATELLTNDLFLDGLSARNEGEIRQFIETTIAAENERLTQENEQLARQVADAQSARDALEFSLRGEMRELLEREIGKKQDESDRIAKEQAAESARALSAQKELQHEAARRAEAEGRRARDAEKRADDLAAQVAAARGDAEKRRSRDRVIAGLAVGLIAYGLFELAIRAFHFTWLLEHPNSYGLRAAVALGLVTTSLGLFRKDWRKFCFGSLFVPLILVVIALLGGATRPVPGTGNAGDSQQAAPPGKSVPQE